ncbi:MAG TPA: hypothetical protein VLF59_00180 [Candidatus Saccharimonadales bacterium]|nr:hypothetical protein [Candidatus Saccharimonadales bacterium]
MFRRKSKQQPDQNPGRRMPLRPGQTSQSSTFSYYASRTTVSGERSMRNQGRTEKPGNKDKPARATVSSPPSRVSRLPLLLLLAVTAVCGIKLLLLGTDPKVVVLGKNTVSATYLRPVSVYESAAEELLAGSITNRAKVTADLGGTATALERQFPELSAVSVTLPLVGNRPIVYAEAAQPSVLLHTNFGTYALNKSGLVLAQLHTQPAGVPLLVDQSGVKPRPGRQFLPGSTIAFLQTFQYQLTSAGYTITNFVLPNGSPYELDMRLDGKPFTLRSSLESDPLAQSGAAVGTLQQLGAVVPANYIDVRVPGRVYYK